ncbi:hypothetical protein OBBRIDRAFT_831176 [Obba rivulosa]|uniref:Uncharacterized protein n=1 Tax=Obba rivulosa TaxID=1052685 RepID=A0A8E2DSP0_9APHY|nr:hypothetical protein OBBRIDRAFT_831176 [Obba rivulosa]
MRRDARLLNIDSPLTSALLRDGTAYFLLLLLLNILQILGNATLVFIYVGNYLSPPLYSLVITHFLLSLRQVNWSSTDTVTDGMLPSFVRSQRDEPQSTSLHSSIRFASFVDNMGEILVHDRAGVDPAAGEVPWHEEGDVQESW